MKKDYRDNATIKKRMWSIIMFLVAVFFTLTLRLSYIMIFKGKKLSDKAVEQWTSEVKIDARRGKIVDRNGVELAVSANVYRIDFDLNSIRNYLAKNELTNEDIAPKIAKATDIEEKDVLKKLNTKLPSGAAAGSANLVRRIEKEYVDKVKELKISGVMVSPDTKRYYPNNNFLSHVLGSTNVDGKGLTGIELQYNEILSGKPGVRIAELGRNSEELPYTITSFTPPVDGKDIVLTIDEKIQLFAEKAATIALNDNKAKSVNVTVMNPENGEVIAMASKPDFNPNNPYEGAENFEGNTSMDKLQKMWRNKVVNDTFECGSIFKIITSIAAMEEDAGDNGEKYNCSGSTVVLNRRIKCWKSGGHGEQDFVGILKNSCNVGFIELSRSLGKEKLNEYIKKFGFGQKTGIDLPGEARGIIKATKDITEVDLATIGFGQTDTVNSIQFLAAFNTIANDGVWIKPHIMKEVTSRGEDGERKVDEKFEAETRKVVSEEQSQKLRGYLEKVVSEGSGKNAYIEGYEIAGKTGTAQKVNPNTGTYEPGKYMSSFVGMAPASDPKISIMITIDEPSNGAYYAGQITTPVAHMLFNDIFNYLDPSLFPKKSEQDAIERNIIIPEVRGLEIGEAKKMLDEIGLKYDIEGSGKIITDISPKPGYSVKADTKINLYSDETSNYNKEVVVPNLAGYTKEAALKLLDSLGLKVGFDGEGVISEQNIPSGELVTKGTVIKCKLSQDLGD